MCSSCIFAKFATSLPPHHRVTLRFAEGDLRADMEAWAAGAVPSARLLLEVQSYRWCKIDDTWAEAAHRDVSRLAKRATFFLSVVGVRVASFTAESHALGFAWHAGSITLWCYVLSMESHW